MIYEDNRTLGAIVRSHARMRPDEICLRFLDRRTSWRELDERSSQIANGLLSDGLDQGTHIGFLGKNGNRYFEILFGAAKAGASVASLNWRLAPPEVKYVLADSEARVLFVDAEFYPNIAEICQELPNLFRIIIVEGEAPELPSFTKWRDAFEKEDPERDGDENSTALLLYTSGTTGHPKGAELSHQYLFDALGMLLKAEDTIWNFAPGETVLLTGPLFHIAGNIVSFAAAAQGCHLLVLKEFEAGEVLRAIDQDSVVLVAAVPAMLEMLLDHPAAATTDFSTLRYIAYGASPMPPALLRRGIDVIGCGFAQNFGMTESTVVTYLSPSDHDPQGNQRMLSVGRALPGVDLSILDPSGAALPVGEVGEVTIRTPSLMSGYWKNPAATAEANRGGRFHTGDAGYLDEDGYLYLKDRIKDTIISGGENIYPAEVEHALYEHPLVQEAAVVGVPDSKWGEVPKAFVVLQSGEALDADSLRSFLLERIARYKIPKHFESIEELPRNASGKVLRRELRG